MESVELTMFDKEEPRGCATLEEENYGRGWKYSVEKLLGNEEQEEEGDLNRLRQGKSLGLN